MNIQVDIAADNFERILSQAGEGSRLRSILLNGIVTHDHQGGVRRRVVRILCEKSDADMLLDATKTLCPGATPEIEKSIALWREP